MSIFGEKTYQVAILIMVGLTLLFLIILMLFLLAQLLHQVIKKFLTSKRLFIATSLIFVLTMAIFLFTASLYLSSKTSLCGYCHAIKQEYVAWKKSPHRNVNCLTCHQDQGIVGYIIRRQEALGNLVRWTINSYRRPIVTQVKDRPCQSCHQEVLQGVVSSQGINVSHKEILEQGYRCTDCHNTVTHGKVVPVKKYATMDMCVSCHNGERASSDCKVCHTEKVKRTRARNLNAMWAIVHSKDWRVVHGMGTLTTCQICHSKDDCADCHQIGLPHSLAFPRQHGTLAQKNRQACLQCHKTNFCDDCHKIEMPHLAKWLPQHSLYAKKLKKELCYRCHIKYDCKDCHERHVHPGLSPERIKQLRGELYK